MLISKQQKNLKALVNDIRRSRTHLATRSNSERILPNEVRDKSALTNPVLWMPFIAGLTLTFYKRASFAGHKTLRLGLELAKSALDTVKTERELELAKRTSGTQTPDESA
ncbi:MAG: hypothetical protein AB8B63_00530 [Granulosicoccus sp.]